MTIERRYCARHPIDLPVSIRYRKRRFICARGCNLSDQGMFLEVRNLTLPTGVLVELELECLGTEWLIPAIVIHHRGSGIGVMFRDRQPVLYQGLTRDSAPLPPPPQAAGATDRRSSAR
jgi:hypothetical protein